MISHIENLHQYAEALRSNSRSLDYVFQTDIERLIFLTAKRIAEFRFDVEVASFLDLRKLLDENGKSHVQTVLELALELIAALSKICMGSEYAHWDLAGPDLPGRRNAVQAFCRRVDRYANDVEEELGLQPG